MLLLLFGLLLQPPEMLTFLEPSTSVLTYKAHLALVGQFAELVVGQPKPHEKRSVSSNLDFKSWNVRGPDVHHTVFVPSPSDFWSSAHLPEQDIDVSDILMASPFKNTIHHT